MKKTKRAKRTVKKTVKTTKPKTVKQPKPKAAKAKSNVDFLPEFTAKMESIGAIKKGEGSYEHNGWKIKASTRGITWHNKFVPEVNGTFDSLMHLIEKRNDKPFTVAALLKEDITRLETLIDRIANSKTKKFLNKEKRALKAEGPKLEKRDWCKGCGLCPGGDDAKECAKLKMSEETGAFYCSDNAFYENYWCKNLKREQNPDKPWQGEVTCGLTGAPCPYAKPSIIQGAFYLQRNSAGEHYTKCPTYVGERTENSIITVADYTISNARKSAFEEEMDSTEVVAGKKKPRKPRKVKKGKRGKRK